MDPIEAAVGLTTTTVALITTVGKVGPNVCAAEWTMMASYEPPLVVTVLHRHHATHAAIMETREFGVNWCSEDQASQSNLAGSFSKHSVDKLTSDAFRTYRAEAIAAPMVEGCVANMECRLEGTAEAGEYTIFIGRVVVARADPTKAPLVLHRGYRSLGPTIPKGDTVVVAVTPGSQRPGGHVTMVGRATGATLGKPVVITIEGEGHRPLLRLNASPDGDGYFEVRGTLPVGTSEGWYRVRAEGAGAGGTARLRVQG